MIIFTKLAIITLLLKSKGCMNVQLLMHELKFLWPRSSALV